MTTRELEALLMAEGHSRKQSVVLASRARNRGETKDPGKLKIWIEKVRKLITPA